MKINVEKLADAEQRYVRGMDNEDMTALKLCLLSAGALAGLSVKGRFARRLLGLGCTILCAGLAIPLAGEYLEELSKDDEPLIGVRVETGEKPDTETVFEVRVDVDKEPEEAEKKDEEET